MPTTIKRVSSLRPFLARLSQLASSLPSQSEIAEAKVALDRLIDFLTGVRRSLDQLPTSDASGSVAELAQVFDRLLDKAESNALVSLAMGIAPKRAQKAPTRQNSGEQLEAANRLYESLTDLTVDQIRERLLADPSIRLSDLRALAAQLHVRSQSKSTRETLAQALVTKIANARGYKGLSEGSDSGLHGR
jgi:hypothetical protein